MNNKTFISLSVFILIFLIIYHFQFGIGSDTLNLLYKFFGGGDSGYIVTTIIISLFWISLFILLYLAFKNTVKIKLVEYTFYTLFFLLAVHILFPLIILLIFSLFSGTPNFGDKGSSSNLMYQGFIDGSGNYVLSGLSS